MPRRIPTILLLSICFVAFGCSEIERTASNEAGEKPDKRVEQLKRQRDAVVRFFEPMQIREMDWLATQREPGETFERYIDSNPTLPTEKRRTIYIQPIGKFNAEQRNAIRVTAEYMRAYYNLPVKLNADRQLGKVPAKKRRMSGYPKRQQIRTQYFLDEILPKLVADDAAALIAFTDSDLYPGDTWAFVFGQATLSERVGVCSLHRLGDIAIQSDNQKDRLLFRTLKIAMHETGHMFSMRHCTKYECLMSGTNHLAETDRRPVDNCPECMAKLAWAMDYDPSERYERLAKFWEKQQNPSLVKKFREKKNAVRNEK